MAELSLLSSSQTTQRNPRSAWMWNPKEQALDDDSWEVRAFAEDTGNVMGTTWPPRSYTCTFCRREFRSAQALGGHMNVHRRDRARLHQVQHPSGIINPSSAGGVSSSSASAASSFMIPTQEFLAANGGLCLLYQLAPNPINNGGAFPTTSTTCATNASLVGNNTNNTSSLHHETSNSSSSLVPSTLLSISPNPLHDYLMTSSSSVVGAHSRSDSHCRYRKRSADDDIQPSKSGVEDSEELDLELRLGPS